MNPRLKQFLHNFFRIFIILLIILGAINLILVGCIYGNHKSKSKKENAYLRAPGEFVQLDGNRIHYYELGNDQAEQTLIFLHSAATTDDAVALQPLFDQLKDDYKLIYIDRSGAGFSDKSEAARDVVAIVEDLRRVLSIKEAKGPYVLVASSTAGILAQHWANTYPEEVASIIGISMNYPEQFDNIAQEDYCGFFDYLMIPFCQIGGLRLVPSLAIEDPYEVYTDLQNKMRNALFMQKGYTKDMYREDYLMIDNANYVKNEGFPHDVPMYLIYANPLLEPYLSKDASVKADYEAALAEDEKNNETHDYVGMYNKEIREFLENKNNVVFEEMGGPARLYTFAPDVLAEKISEYLENLKIK